jgi:F-type H+-transporting ATPase subunit b
MDINLTLLMQMLAFGAFVVFCAKFIWPPLTRAVDKRQQQIAAGLAAGEEGRQNLAQAEKRLAAMMTDAKSRAAEIVAQGEKRKSESIEQAKDAAKVEGERIVALGRAEIEQELVRARDVLRSQVAELAVAGAARILRREVDAGRHADLLASLQKQL